MDPHAKKSEPSANKAKRETRKNSNAEPRKSPVSENTAMERHANAKQDEEDLPNTQDLPNRGMEHVNEENVTHEDPHMSPEASVMGMSAECADGTLVLLESAPHETRNLPQDSLPLTPRLPIEGEPHGCKQEVAESVVTAERTNGTVTTAEPLADADIDRMALLSGEPAERASGVDKGDGTEHRDLQLQQTNLLCEETRQHNRNAEEDIPSAQRLLLEGEWAGCASGKSNKSKGCSRSCEVRPADTLNKSETLVTLSIESEDPHSGETLCMYLGGMRMHADDVNGLGCQTDGSRSQADGPGGLMDAPSMSKKAETDVISHRDGMNTYLGAGDTKRDGDEVNGVGSQTDVSTWHGDVQSVRTDVVIPEKATDNVRTTRTKEKLPDLPMETTRGRPGEPNGCGNHADGSSARMDAHTTEDKTQMAVNEMENVRKHRNGQRTQNSSYTAEIETPKPTRRWKRVSVEGVDVYLPWDVPVEMPSRTFAFG